MGVVPWVFCARFLPIAERKLQLLTTLPTQKSMAVLSQVRFQRYNQRKQSRRVLQRQLPSIGILNLYNMLSQAALRMALVQQKDGIPLPAGERLISLHCSSLFVCNAPSSSERCYVCFVIWISVFLRKGDYPPIRCCP